MRPRARVVRDQLRELTDIFNAWDPADLISAGAPTDEYNCIVVPLLGMLAKGSSASEIEEWLRMQLKETFEADPESLGSFIRKIVVWFDAKPAV